MRHLSVDRGVIVEPRTPVWVWLLLALTGGFFGTVAHLWLGGA